MNFFTIFTMPIVFLRHFYIIYVETAFHVTVPLKCFLGNFKCFFFLLENRTLLTPSPPPYWNFAIIFVKTPT